MIIWIMAAWLAFQMVGLLVTCSIWAAIRYCAGATFYGDQLSWVPPKNVLKASLVFGPFSWVLAGLRWFRD